MRRVATCLMLCIILLLICLQVDEMQQPLILGHMGLRVAAFLCCLGIAWNTACYFVEDLNREG